MDIKSFTNWGGQEGRAGGIIRSEKLENHTNSTHTKIQFYIISIYFIFSMMDITIFTDGKGGMGRYPFIKLRKSQKQYP